MNSAGPGLWCGLCDAGAVTGQRSEAVVDAASLCEGFGFTGVESWDERDQLVCGEHRPSGLRHSSPAWA